MNNYAEKKQKAEQLRKSGDYKGALPIFRELWNEYNDQSVGAGLLHCLRKLILFDEAIPFADGLIKQFPNFNWIRLEVIWTYIFGILEKLPDNSPIEIVIQTAQRILDLNAEEIAKAKVILKVMKTAKDAEEWDLLNEWAEKVDPASLSLKPMTDERGKEIWSQQGRWYLYRITSHLNKKESTRVIELVDTILDRFPKHQKFFLRLKASAYIQLNKLPEAEKLYQLLASRYRTDCWLIYDYAKLMRDLNRKEDALKLMYQAASGSAKLETLVRLFADIGGLCKELGKNAEAKAHFLLIKSIREHHNWSIPQPLSTQIADLTEVLGPQPEPTSVEEAWNICKEYWQKTVDTDFPQKPHQPAARQLRTGLSGILRLGPPERYFCFINAANGESFFCLKSDLPPDIPEGAPVSFEAIPSYDKKKQKDSWKAINIQLEK